MSLRLDAELSELESTRLEAHLGRCADCREFATTVEAATLQLRSAPVERPELTIDVPARRRQRAAHALQLGAAAALVAAAAGLGTLFGTLGSGGRHPAARPAQTSGLLAFNASPEGLARSSPVTAQQKPAATVPRNLWIPNV